MTAIEKAKEIFTRIKAAFDIPAPPPAVPPAVPAAPAALATPTVKVYKLQDGVTDIVINQAGETPAIGDTVMIGGLPAAANTYTLSDGATIVVDAAGVITTYTAMAAPPPPPPAPPALPQPVTLSAEDFAAIVARFATGSNEERLTNAEAMLKALMECNFGYDIRKGQEAAAIEAYRESLAPLQTAVTEMTSQLKASTDKITEQQAAITKYGETIKGLFELCEQLTELPTAEPVTLTGTRKEKFENQNKKEDRIAKMAAAVKAMKEEAKK